MVPPAPRVRGLGHQIVREAAAGLANADITVLNGADGLGEIAAGLVSQGLTILESVRRSIGDPAGQPSSNGASPQRLPSAPDAPATGR